jgi:hypothetical protein
VRPLDLSGAPITGVPRLTDVGGTTQGSATSTPGALVGKPIRHVFGVLAVTGVVATATTVVGGALAGASGAPRATGWWEWTVPLIPVQPTSPIIPALGLFYAGIILLCRAWLWLRQAVRYRQLRSVHVIALAALWAVPLLLGPPLASRDVYSYIGTGEIAAAGRDPYRPDVPSTPADVRPAVDPIWRDGPTPYGPIFTVAEKTLVRVSGRSLIVRVLAFRLLALAGLAAAALGVSWLAAAMRRNQADALALLLCNPITLLHLVSGAHNEALMIGFLAIGTGLCMSTRRRLVWWVGLVFCVAATAVKAPAALAVLALLCKGFGPAAPKRLWVRLAAGGTLSVAVLDVIGRSTGYGWGWARIIARSGATVFSYLSPVALVGAASQHVAKVLGANSDPSTAIRTLAALFGVGYTIRRLRRSTGHDWPNALGSVFFVSAVMLPSMQPWYLTWALVLLAAADGGRSGRRIVVVSVLMSFLVLPAGPSLGNAIFHGGYQATMVKTAAVLVALIAVGFSAEWRETWQNRRVLTTRQS